MNHLGMRGGHFEAALKEFATLLLTKPGGCALLQGPFALSLNGALRKVLYTWGSRLTWTAQREHAAQIVEGMVAFCALQDPSIDIALPSTVIPSQSGGTARGGADWGLLPGD